MATDAATTHGDNLKPSMTVGHVVAFTKKELEADAERQAKVSATGSDGLESQTGATLDLSHKNIQALPVEVIALIKDRVERCVTADGGRLHWSCWLTGGQTRAFTQPADICTEPDRTVRSTAIFEHTMELTQALPTRGTLPCRSRHGMSTC